MFRLKSRERVLRALEHQEVDVLPFNGGFGSMEAIRRFLGERFYEANDVEQKIFLARLFNSDIVNFPTMGFPGGPGLFEEVLSEGSDHIVAKTPVSGLVYWRKIPYFARALDGPVRYEEDLERMERPNIEEFKPKVKQMAKKVRKLQELGYFVMSEIKGPLETPWMYLRGGPRNFFLDIIRRPAFAARLVAFIFEPTIQLAELVSDETGIDAIWMTDDLGETHAPFISPEKYRALIKPWHSEVVKRIHKKGAKLCLHSHGNIMPLLNDIVETGPDSIDPLDIADNINVPEVKKRHGYQICLMGGITKDIGRMSEDETSKHVQSIANECGPYGYIMGTAGGVPSEMTLSQLNAFKEAVDKARGIQRGTRSSKADCS